MMSRLHANERSDPGRSSQERGLERDLIGAKGGRSSTKATRRIRYDSSFSKR